MLFLVVSCSQAQNTNTLSKTEEEWKAKLTPEQYRITRLKGTERPFTGKYWNHTDEGAYKCIGCGTVLFSSDTKYDAGCGWPSFYDAIDSGNIKTAKDYSLGMKRIEIMCNNCDAHLGHLFDDGPNPTGMRYCVNSESLNFEKKE